MTISSLLLSPIQPLIHPFIHPTFTKDLPSAGPVLGAGALRGAVMFLSSRTTEVVGAKMNHDDGTI